MVKNILKSANGMRDNWLENEACMGDLVLQFILFCFKNMIDRLKPSGSLCV